MEERLYPTVYVKLWKISTKRNIHNFIKEQLKLAPEEVLAIEIPSAREVYISLNNEKNALKIFRKIKFECEEIKRMVDVNELQIIPGIPVTLKITGIPWGCNFDTNIFFSKLGHYGTISGDMMDGKWDSSMPYPVFNGEKFLKMKMIKQLPTKLKVEKYMVSIRTTINLEEIDEHLQ